MPATHTLEHAVEKHVPLILALDCESCSYFDEDIGRKVVHKHAWTEGALKEFLGAKNSTTYLCSDKKGNTVGYIAWSLRKDEIVIWALVVHPLFRRRGYGTAMMAKLAEAMLTSERPLTVRVFVREEDLASQWFFASKHFQSRVARRFWGDDDAVEFTLEYDPEK